MAAAVHAEVECSRRAACDGDDNGLEPQSLLITKYAPAPAGAPPRFGNAPFSPGPDPPFCLVHNMAAERHPGTASFAARGNGSLSLTPVSGSCRTRSVDGDERR